MDECIQPSDEYLYSENDPISESVTDTPNEILKELDSILIDKVRRITIKGQIDGK